jgi:hypothetical protein
MWGIAVRAPRRFVATVAFLAKIPRKISATEQHACWRSSCTERNRVRKFTRVLRPRPAAADSAFVAAASCRGRARSSIFLEQLEQLQEALMGSNSLQGWAILVMLVAFTAFSLAFRQGSVLWMLVFVVALSFSIVLFLKAKPLEN